MFEKEKCRNATSKIEKIPRGIQGEKSSKDMASESNEFDWGT